MAEETPDTQEGNGLSRRELLAKAGAIGAGAIAAGSLAGGATAASKALVRDADAAPGRNAHLRARVRSGGSGAVRHGARRGALGQGAHLRLAGGVRPGAEHQARAREVLEGREERVTFTLRKGVRFHNGKELTAADVVYSVKNMKNPPPPGSADGRGERPGDDHRRAGRLEVRGAADAVGAGRARHRLLRLAAVRAHRPGGALRPDQREPAGDRHRPLPAGQLHPARPRRAGAQRALLEARSAVHGRDHHEGDDRRAGARRGSARRRHRRGDAVGRRRAVAPERGEPAGAERSERGLPRAADDAQAGQERALGGPARAPGGELRDQPPADHPERLQRRGRLHVVRPARVRPLAAHGGAT